MMMMKMRVSKTISFIGSLAYYAVFIDSATEAAFSPTATMGVRRYPISGTSCPLATTGSHQHRHGCRRAGGVRILSSADSAENIDTDAVGDGNHASQPDRIAARVAFQRFDLDGSKGLNAWELHDALEYLDYKISFEATSALLSEFDTDKNGEIDMEELSTLLQAKIPKDVCEVHNAFASRRGLLTPGDLRRALSSLGIDMKSAAAKEVLSHADANGDGLLGPLGFAELVSHLPVAQVWLTIDPRGILRRRLFQTTNALTRAPKKPVSRHSALATVFLGLVVASTSMIFSPGVDPWGLPRLLHVTRKLNPAEEIAFRLASFLASVVALSGLFRIPPNAPSSRRTMFQLSAAVTLEGSLIADSNLSLLDSFSVDAFSFLGKSVVSTSVLASMLIGLKFLHNGITGSNKGRDTIPLVSNKVWTTLTGLVIYTLLVFTVPLALPMFFDKGILALVNQSGPLNLTVFLTLLAFQIGFSSLLMTLRFEGKIAKKVALRWNLLVLALFNADSIKSLVMVLRDQPRCAPDVVAAVNKVIQGTYVYELSALACIGTMAHAFCQNFQILKRLGLRKGKPSLDEESPANVLLESS